MKNILISALLLSLFATPGFTQAPSRTGSYTFTTATTSAVIDVSNSNVSVHSIRWSFIGAAASACTINLQGSSDQTTWTTFSSTLTCTSNGTSQFYTAYYPYIRINVASLTIRTGNSLSVNYLGYFPTPSDAAIVDNTSDPLQVMGASAFATTSTNLTTQGTPTGLWTARITPGIFIALVVGVKATQASSTMTCYDSVSTGTLTSQIVKLDTTNYLGVLPLGIRVVNGIVCSGTGSSDVTILSK